MEWTQPFGPAASSGSEASPRSWSLSGAAATPSPPSSSSSSSSSRSHGDEGAQQQQQQQQQEEGEEGEEDQPLLWAIELVLDRVGAASRWSAPTLPWATIQALRQLAPAVVTRSAGDGLLDRLNVLGLLNWVHNRSPVQWPRGAISRALAALVVASPASIRPAGRRLLGLALLHMAVAPLCAEPPDWGGFSSAMADDDLWESACRDNADDDGDKEDGMEAVMGVRARLAQLLADIQKAAEAEEALQARERGREAAVALVAAACPLDAFRRQFEGYMGAFHAQLPPPFLDQLARDIRSWAYHPPGTRAEDERSIDLTPTGPGSGDEEEEQEAEMERQPTPRTTTRTTTAYARNGNDDEEKEVVVESGPQKDSEEEIEEWEDAQQPDGSGDREAPPIREKEKGEKHDDDDEGQGEEGEDEDEDEDERAAGRGGERDRRETAKDKRRRSDGSADATGRTKRRKLLTDEHDDEVKVNARVKPHWHRRRSTGSSSTTATRTTTTVSSAGRRRRRRWTEDEVANLLAGVKKYTTVSRGVLTRPRHARFGVGCWKHIVEHYRFGGRTAVDLKDKYRNLEREWEKQATHHHPPPPAPAPAPAPAAVAPAPARRRVSVPDTNTSLDDDIEEWTPSGGNTGRGSSRAGSAKTPGAKRPNLDFIMTRGGQEEHRRRSSGAEDSS